MNTCSCSTGGSKLPCVGKLLIRIAVAAVFIYAGYGKFAMADVAQAGFEALFGAAWLSSVVGAVEIIAGVMILVGFQVRIAGVVLAIIMIVAILTAHKGQSFGEIMLPFTMLLTSLGLAFMGPGCLSVERCTKKDAFPAVGM